MKKNLISLFKILEKLNYILTRKQKLKSIKVGFWAITGSFLELLGISAILPFIQAITDVDSLMEKKYIMVLCNIINITKREQILVVLGIAIMGIYILKNIIMIYCYYVQYDYSTQISKDLSVKMLDSYLKRPYEFFLETNSAEIIRGCTGDVNGIYNILYNIISLITEVITMTMIGIYLIYTDLIIAVSVIVLMIIVLMGMLFIFKPIFKKIGKKWFVVAVDKNRVLYQTISGAKEIFVNQRQEMFKCQYAEVADEERKINRVKETLSQSPNRITEGICVAGVIGIVCYRLLMDSANIEMFIPKLATFAMAAFQIFPSIGKITSRLNIIVFQMPALENVYNNMKIANEQNTENRVENKEKKYDIDNECAELKNEIAISNVYWKYENQDKPVFNNLSLNIKKGQLIGLIGASGAGKTTLVDIVLGLLKPQKGEITLDGTNIEFIPNQWANIVGYVPQTIYLIDDTVRNNVLFGLDKEESDDGIWEALQKAQIDDFIRSLPEGLDTIVGERGVKFSGGQRQRIAIARALYGKPELLILDEATAALDNETETAVMEAIEMLQGEITMIIVAHRLTTIKKCDYIYAIEDGSAVLKEKEDIFGR